MDVSAPPPPRLTEKDVEHLRLLSIFHYVVAGLMVLCGCSPIFHVAMGAFVTFAPSQQLGPDASASRLFGVLFMGMGLVMMLLAWTFAAAIAFAGKSIQARKRWTFCIVIAGLLSMMMPFGTALGVFTIIVLLRENVKWVFQNGEL